MTYLEKEKRRARGRALLVIGSIIIVFFGVYGYLVYLQAPGWGATLIFPTVVGVVILVIGLLLIVSSREKSPIAT